MNDQADQIEYEFMPYGKVLIVDDMEASIRSVIWMLKPYGVMIDTVLSGFEAISIIEKGKEYDIIFMDYLMPKLDGIATTKNLRAMGYTKPIVALTANILSDQTEMFLQNGFDGFMSKPIDFYQLDCLLKTFLRDKQPAAVINAAKQQQEKAKAQGDAKQKHARRMIWRPKEKTEQPLESMSEATTESTTEATTETTTKATTELSSTPESAPEPTMLKAFLNDANKTVTTLDELLNTEKWVDNNELLDLFITTVHGIKGSLRSIGEEIFSNEAECLEKSGKANNISYITEATPEFKNKLLEIIEKYDIFYSVNINNDCETGESLQQKLQCIMEHCDDFDRKAVLDILASIQNPTDKINQILEEIKQNILHSKFDEAKIIAASCSEELENEENNIYC